MRKLSLLTLIISAFLLISVVVNFFIIFHVHDSLDLYPYKREVALRSQRKVKNTKSISRTLDQDDDIENIQNPLLPKHTILVTGLESSGTKYITSALSFATSTIKLKKDRPIEMKNFHDRVGGFESPNQIEILHHSLPHGAWCTIFGKQLENMTSNELIEAFKSWTIPFIPPRKCSCGLDRNYETIKRHNVHDLITVKNITKDKEKGENWKKNHADQDKKEIEEKIIQMGDSKEWDRWMKIRAEHNQKENEEKVQVLENKPASNKENIDKSVAYVRSKHMPSSNDMIKNGLRELPETLPAIFKASNKICDSWETNNAKYGQNTQEKCVNVGIHKPIELPPRHFVNISSHIKWYQKRGIRATAVIVVREKTIEFLSKYNDHCQDEKVSNAENEYGKRFIIDAFNNLSQEGSTPSLVIISYETLMAFGESYLKKVVYPKLGIDLDKNIFIPPLHDSNEHYVNKTYTKPKKTDIEEKKEECEKRKMKYNESKRMCMTTEKLSKTAI